MTELIASYAFVLLTIVSVSSQPDTSQLKGCPVTSRTLILQATPKPVVVTGALLKAGKTEYRLRVKSDLKVSVRLITSSQLRLDIYSFKPPTRIKTTGLDWSDTLSKDNEYALVVNNCLGTSNGTYRIEITTIR